MTCYLKKDLEKSMNSLEIENFQSKNDNKSFVLNKISKHKTDIIIIGYKETSNGFILRKPVIKIQFHEVEEILNESNLDKNIKVKYGSDTIAVSWSVYEDFNFNIYETEINDILSFQKASGELKRIVREKIIPFFERFVTLRQVYEKTEIMPIKQMSSFLGQPLPLRRMIIKKLCNDVKYEEYSKMVIDFYEQEKDPDEPIVKELYNILKTR